MLKSKYRRSGHSVEVSEYVSVECLMRYIFRLVAVMLAGLWPVVSAGDAHNLFLEQYSNLHLISYVIPGFTVRDEAHCQG